MGKRAGECEHGDRYREPQASIHVLVLTSAWLMSQYPEMPTPNHGARQSAWAPRSRGRAAKQGIFGAMRSLTLCLLMLWMAPAAAVSLGTIPVPPDTGDVDETIERARVALEAEKYAEAGKALDEVAAEAGLRQTFEGRAVTRHPAAGVGGRRGPRGLSRRARIHGDRQRLSRRQGRAMGDACPPGARVDRQLGGRGARDKHRGEGLAGGAAGYRKRDHPVDRTEDERATKSSLPTGSRC